MGISITVRDLPQETRDALAARAAASGRSLQEYLSLQLIALASKPTINDALQEIRARARTFPPMSGDLTADIDADRH